MFSRATSFGRNASQTALLTRGTKSVLKPYPTPPSWYQKHALMYGEYTSTPPNHINLESLSSYPSSIDAKPEPQATFRTSLPPVHSCNVQDQGLYSMILSKWIRVKVSTEALKLMDKMGGLDHYIMATPIEDLGGPKSVAGVLRRMMRERLLEKSGEAPVGKRSDKVGSILGLGAKEKVLKYQAVEETLSWRDGLKPEFWDKIQV